MDKAGKSNIINRIIYSSISLFILISGGFIDPVPARGADIPVFRFSGYGTLGYTADDRSDLVPIRDFSQEPEDKYKTDSTTWRLDSRIGLQGLYRISSKWEALVQGVLRDQVEQNLNNILELGYIRFKAACEWEFRIGRFGYDVFLMSDTRNIGYANLWVRPPTEFYGWVPIYSVDGIDSLIQWDTDRAEWQFKFQLGRSKTDLPIGDDTYHLETDGLFSVTLSRHDGPFSLKAGYSQFSLQNRVQPFKQLHQGLTSVASATQHTFPDISAEALYLRQHIAFKDNTIRYLTLGAGYDNGRWVAQAEVSHTTSDTHIMPHGNMGYLSLGRRLGDWTPYILFSFFRPQNDIYQKKSDWSIIGPEPFHKQALYLINSIRTDQETYSAGVRWDFHNQAAFKIQWDHCRIKPYYGLWYRSIDTACHTSHINLLTFCLEFIF